MESDANSEASHNEFGGEMANDGEQSRGGNGNNLGGEDVAAENAVAVVVGSVEDDETTYLSHSSSSSQRRRMNPNDHPSPTNNKYVVYYSALSRALRQDAGSSSPSTASHSILHLLSDGAGLILGAGREAGYRVDKVEFLTTVRGEDSLPGTDLAALFLKAVSLNVLSLSAALLCVGGGGGEFLTGGAGGRILSPPIVHGNGSELDGGVVGTANGEVRAQHVVEIVAASGVAASFTHSPSLIGRSGIVQALSRLIDIASSGGHEDTDVTLLVPQCNINHRVVDNILTPFHAEFLRLCLLAGQYRYASTFLAARPTHQATLDCPYLRFDPTSILRAHYYAGLVHLGCENWHEALDSFSACMVVPCLTVSPIAVAARKKGLLVRCWLLESEELDGRRKGGRGASDSAVAGGKAEGDARTSSTLVDQVLALPGAASAAVVKYMSLGGGTGSAPCDVVGGVGGKHSTLLAPERTGGEGSSEMGGGKEQLSRRRTRGANPDCRSSMMLSRRRRDRGGDDGDRRGGQGENSRVDSHLGRYHDLVSAYVSGKTDQYVKLLTEMTDLLYTDGNWELGKQLERRLLVYRSIRKVALVYSVVGVDVLEGSSDITRAGEVGKRGIEDILMGMTRSDSGDPLLFDPFVARMDHSTNMVSFLDDDDDDNDDYTRRMDADLSARLQSCIALAQRVRDLDIALTTSPKYQQLVMKESMMRGDRGSSAMAKLQGASVADIGDGTMDVGGDW